MRADRLFDLPPGQIAAAPDQFALEGARLTFQSIPAVAFRVLNGMLGQFSVGWAHLDCWSLRDRRTGVNLLSTDAAFPGPPPGKIALPLGIDPNSRGENISIVIEFAHSIDASSRETIAKTLEAWKELLNGGYPFHASSGSPWSTGDPLEGTGVAGSVRFLDPSTAVIHMEFVRAAPESATPLTNTPALQLARPLSNCQGLRRILSPEPAEVAIAHCGRRDVRSVGGRVGEAPPIGAKNCALMRSRTPPIRCRPTPGACARCGGKFESISLP
jgi:hypothetical protein